jgi:lipopolysaccharide/colanic/teichoic acid biosynthesis glycosyltransferase
MGARLQTGLHLHVSQPLEKIRDETLVRKRRPVPARIDTRAVMPVISPMPVRADIFVDIEQAIESKPRFLICKRVADVVTAIVALVVLSPVLLLISLAIALTSKGPVLFKQTRFGRDNIPFTLVKFRSMYVDRQDLSGIAHTVERDPRITTVGHFIRRWYLDELPQLINVLKGDMSIVGPRAQVMGMRAVGISYEDLVPNYRARHAVRPGITGLAQVRGFRGEIKDTAHAIARVDADLEYIQRASLWLDFKILMLTLPSVVLGSIDC